MPPKKIAPPRTTKHSTTDSAVPAQAIQSLPIDQWLTVTVAGRLWQVSRCDEGFDLIDCTRGESYERASAIRVIRFLRRVAKGR